MPLDVGRVTHLLEQMHRTEDDAGDPIAAGLIPAADGARGIQWVSGAGTGLDWFNVVDYGAVGDNTTDDSAAVQAAWDACAAAGGGVVYYPDNSTNGPGYYVGGTLVDTSGYNSILKIPDLSSFYAMKHLGGSRRVYLRSDWNGTISGNPAVIAAGTHDSLTLNQVFLEAENLSVITHVDPKLTAWDLTAAATFRFGDNVGAGVNGDATAAVPTHSNAIGFDLPWAKNDQNTGGVGLYIEGYYYGLRPSEQMVALSVYVSYCKWLGQLRGSVGSPNFLQHAATIQRLNDWFNTNGFEVTGDDRSIVIDLWDIEQDPSPWTRVTDIEDSGNLLYGFARVQPSDYGGAPNTTFVVNGGANFGLHIIPAGPPSGGGSLDDLSDVTITAPAADDQLQYVGGVWVNNARRWEPVTTNPGGGPELVWDGDDIVMTWRTY